MSPCRIVDYNDKQLEKLSLYARNLRPMLREAILDDDEIDLNGVFDLLKLAQP